MPEYFHAYLKDPSDVVILAIDWDDATQDFLGSDTITGTPTWTLEGDLALVSQTNTTTTASAKISGGEHGSDYRVSCVITTTGGQTFKRSVVVRVRDR
jgi:hypothetical protein